MLDAKIMWLICAVGFVLLAIGILALSVAVWIDRKETKHIRRDVSKCVIRIIDLEQADK